MLGNALNRLLARACANQHFVTLSCHFVSATFPKMARKFDKVFRDGSGDKVFPIRWATKCGNPGSSCY